MNIPRFFLFSLLGVIVPVLCIAASDPVVSVHVRPYNSVPGKIVTLKDIAEIKAPEQILKRLEEIRITECPTPGHNRKLPGSMINSKIRSFFSGGIKDADVTIPELVVVDRAAQEVTEAELKALFYDTLKKKAGGKQFNLRDVSIRGNRMIPQGKKELIVDDRGISRLGGRISITVLARGGDERPQRIFVSGWVDLFGQVVCADKDIRPGDVITRADLRVVDKNMSKSPPGLMNDLQSVEGTVAKGRIGKGVCIRDTMIEEAPLIRKGNAVKIVAKSGLLSVVATGISKEDGRMGDQIVVENNRSKKDVTGRVVNNETVEVLF